MKLLKKEFYDKYQTYSIGKSTLFSRADYVRHSNSIIKRIGKYLPDEFDAKILVIACGVGFEVFALQQSGYSNVTGIDISKEQVASAEKFCTNILQADVYNFLALSSNSQYDCILAFDLIEHFNKHESISFINLLYSSIKQGGNIILQTPNADSPFSSSIFYGDITHEFIYTPSSLNSVLLMIGFCRINFLECGPIVHGVKSFIRNIIWKLLRGFVTLWNISEMGEGGSSICTRVFIAIAYK